MAEGSHVIIPTVEEARAVGVPLKEGSVLAPANPYERVS